MSQETQRLAPLAGGEITVMIHPLDELFHFISERDWIDAAQMRFRNHGHTSQSVICVDAKGKVCTRGLHFRTAAYPVRVYAVDTAPYGRAAYEKEAL
jgi:hypothetical protein